MSHSQNDFTKGLDKFLPSRTERREQPESCLSRFTRNFTNCPWGTVIIQVHEMFRGGGSRGYRGEKICPVAPERGMKLSTPSLLHGPTAAERKARKVSKVAGQSY